MSIPSIDDFRDSNVDEVKLIEVIEVKSIFGDGDGEPGHTPTRQITQYFSKEGKLLATVDKWADPNRKANHT